MPTDKKIINLGCGKKIMEDAVNIDKLHLPGVDLVIDFVKDNWTEGLNDFDEVIADYVFCQIQDRDDFMRVMNDIWRILKPGGVLKIKVPDARFPAAFQDPMDCRYFVKETFDYFNRGHYRWYGFDYGFKGWELLKVEKEREDRLYAELRKPKSD